MADETVVTTPQTAVIDTPAGDATGNTQTAEGKSFTQADVDRIVSERLARAKTTNDQAVAKAKQEAEAKALADQGEYKKLYEQQQADLKTKEEQIKTMELDALRRRVALRLSLPDGLHDRLRGETEADIETDAKALLASIPKPGAPNINSGGTGKPAPVTPEQIAESKKRSGDYVAF